MHGKALQLTLGVCALIALIPVFLWLGPILFDSVDSRWEDSLGGLAVSVPIALGLAAMAFAAHGLTLHGELAYDLEEGLAELLARDPLLGSITAPTSGAAATGAQYASQTTTTTTAVAVAAPTLATAGEPEIETPAASTKKKKIPQAGRRAKRKAGQKAKAGARNAFRKQANRMFEQF